jgi:hypothetical protein
MPAGERHAVPLPPDAPPSSPPALDEHVLKEAWRIQRPGNPLRPRRRARGRFRFDAPGGEYPVTYVNLDRHACYAEVFGDAGEIPPAAADRRLFRLRAKRPLRVVALDRATVQKAFGLDLNVCSSLDYERTRAWSLALHTWYPEADGIRYLGRHAVEDLNLCLFLDRCGDALEAAAEGSLGELRRDGLVAAHRYHLAPRLFFWEEP